MSKPIIAINLALAIAAALVAGAAEAKPDLVIDHAAFDTGYEPKIGTCARLTVRVKNIGNVLANEITATRMRVFPTNNAFQTVFDKNVFMSAMMPGGTQTRKIDNINFPSAGQYTVQVTADAEQKVDESNEDNNTWTAQFNVTEPCGDAPPAPGQPRPPSVIPGTNPRGCDVEAKFGPPPGTTLPSGQAVQWSVEFRNIGSQRCVGARVALHRYTNNCSGYGVRVGGSGAWQVLPILLQNQSATLQFPETNPPPSGTYCYNLQYSPNNYSDDNNANHRPSRKVTFQ